MSKATKEEKEHFARVAALGCYIDVHFPDLKQCAGYVNIHHKLGEGRNHAKVIPLCTNHHVQWSPLGFGHSVHNGTKSFEARYGTQQEMLEWVETNLF